MPPLQPPPPPDCLYLSVEKLADYRRHSRADVPRPSSPDFLLLLVASVCSCISRSSPDLYATDARARTRTFDGRRAADRRTACGMRVAPCALSLSLSLSLYVSPDDGRGREARPPLRTLMRPPPCTVALSPKEPNFSVNNGKNRFLRQPLREERRTTECRVRMEREAGIKRSDLHSGTFLLSLHILFFCKFHILKGPRAR